MLGAKQRRLWRGGGILMKSNTKRPDEKAMWRILERYSDGPEGIILRLAWLHGLGRKELNQLTWNQVDFEIGNLILSDRTVPIEESTARCLRSRYSHYGAISPRVVIADRGKKPMTLENVSRLAKKALDSEGQEITLRELRHDWILRQIETKGWAYAARVSGMTVSSLRATFPAALREKKAQTVEAPQASEDETEYTLWRIVQQEGDSAAGLAIWMCWKLAMQPGEIAALTWKQVDIEGGCIHLSDRDIDMGTRMQRLLGNAWKRQKNLNEPQIFVAPTTGRPMDQARLSVLCRTAMIRGGLEDFSLRILSAWTHARRVDSALMQRAEELGFLVREDVIQLLNVSGKTAWSYLDRMADSGKLVKVGVRYYPQGSVVAPENQLETIQAYLAEHGTGSRQDIMELLHIAPHQATHILQGMVKRGKLRREGKRYLLPSDSEIEKI